MVLLKELLGLDVHKAANSTILLQSAIRCLTIMPHTMPRQVLGRYCVALAITDYAWVSRVALYF